MRALARVVNSPVRPLFCAQRAQPAQALARLQKRAILPRMQRYRALDSWRGLCALLVVVFHLNQAVNWSLLDAPAIRNFDLFVDFFFVLSGFVIATAYEDRLKQGYGIVPYMLRRFGRLYPLHLAMLAAMLVFAFTRVPLSEFSLRAVFDGGIFDFSAIFTNLLLLHGIGAENHLTWNYPSWSISAEFYTYLIFALIWALMAKRALAIAVALAIVCPVLIVAFPEPSLSVMTLARCVFGFAAGVLVQHLHRRIGPAPRALNDAPAATTAELCAVGLCAAFIGFSDGQIWLAPFVFAAVVFVFGFEAGWLSRLLRTPPFLALGDYSYSIYMTHAVLIFFGWRAVAVMEERLGWHVSSSPAGDERQLWGSSPLAGDAVMLGMLALVIAVSALTYAAIEKPGREWGRVASQRWRRGGFAEVLRPRGPEAGASKAAD